MAAVAAGLMLWSCSSGSRGGGSGGGGTGAEDSPGQPVDPDDDSGSGTDDPGSTGEGDDPTVDADGGGAGDADGPDSDPAGSGAPVIDCSGVAYVETGVNSTPFYEFIPAYALPADILGELRPNAVDLTEDFPSPCHQGGLRSCVAWQVAYGMMSYYAASRLDDWGAPVSSDRQFSPPYLFNHANAFALGRSRADSCERSGTFVSDALIFVQLNGCALMSDVPHRNDRECATLRSLIPIEETAERARRYRIAYYRRLEHDAETMKTYLVEELPPLLVIHAGPAFEALRGPDAYDVMEPEGSAHVILLVGYDDYRGAFRALNSWGTDWGDGGYCWISYDVWPDVVAEAWITAPALADAAGDLVSGFTPVSNPYRDSDGDGLPDSMEREFADRGYDPERPDGVNNDDLTALIDRDEDGWPDEAENLYGTDPESEASFPFMPGFAYPEGFFETFDNADEGVLETDRDLLNPADTSDDDGDGVPGSLDLCPDSTPGIWVDANGCELFL
ncbi:MAG: C1 family peptidase [bacterium]|nr:C1 family peptidase [bacterium]